jgi:hypothetical protein
MSRQALHADAARHRAHPQFLAARNVHIRGPFITAAVDRSTGLKASWL